MRGRTNIPPRIGGIVNGVIRECTVADTNDIDIGDYVQLLEGTDEAYVVQYRDIAEGAGANTQGMFELSDGSCLYFDSIAGDSSNAGTLEAVVCRKKMKRLTEVARYLIYSKSYFGCGFISTSSSSEFRTFFSACELGEDKFILSLHFSGYRTTPNVSANVNKYYLVKYNVETQTVTYTELSVPTSTTSCTYCISCVHLGEMKIAILGGDVNDSSYSSSSGQPNNCYVSTFQLDEENSALVLIDSKIATEAYSLLDYRYSAQGFWHSGVFVSVQPSGIVAYAVASDGTIGNYLGESNNSSNHVNSAFVKLDEGIYCRLYQPNFITELSIDTPSVLQVQLLRISTEGILLETGGSITVDISSYPEISTSNVIYAVLGGYVIPLDEKRLLVAVPIWGMYEYAAVVKSSKVVALKLGVCEYDEQTGFTLCELNDEILFFDKEEGSGSYRSDGFMNNAVGVGYCTAGICTDEETAILALKGGSLASIYDSENVMYAGSFSCSGCYTCWLSIHVSQNIITPAYDTLLVKHYVSKIAGIAKTSGSNGEVIEVYMPK